MAALMTSLRALQRSSATIAGRSFASAAASPLSVLVIDGYSPDGRADLEAGGASTAGKLYVDLLTKSTPGGNVACDVVYPADSDFQVPDLSKVRQGRAGLPHCRTAARMLTRHPRLLLVSRGHVDGLLVDHPRRHGRARDQAD